MIAVSSDPLKDITELKKAIFVMMGEKAMRNDLDVGKALLSRGEN
jgi:hypothetical protein